MPENASEVIRRPRPRWVVPAGIAAVALALRLLGIGWGLPSSEHYFSYHPDEIFLLLPSFHFASGDWNPHFFNYGTFYPYLVGIPAVLFGLVPGLPFPQGLAPLYLLGRAITAILGAATVLPLYAALRREDRNLAFVSASLLAICPLHLLNSHYATVDVPATFFLTLAFLFALRGAERPTGRTAALVGLTVGLAAATKYSAGVFVIPALLAPLLAGRSKPRIVWWLVLPVGAVAGFLIGTPYIASPAFRQGFLFEFRHAQVGGTLAFVGTGSGWAYHLLRGLPAGLGYPLLALCAVGSVLALGSRSPAVRLSLTWVALYLILIGFGRERFIRYLVPVTPFVCTIAAYACEALRGAEKRAWRQVGARWLQLAVLGLTFLYSLGQILPLAADHRGFVWLQVESDILDERRNARIGLVHAPWYFHPPVSPYNAGAFSRDMFEPWNVARGGRIVVTGWDVGALQAGRPQVFVTSDLETADPLRLGDRAAEEFLGALEQMYGNRRSLAAPLTPFAWLSPGRDWAPPDWLYPSPRITVYYSPRP